jgi:PilZ domain
MDAMLKKIRTLWEMCPKPWEGRPAAPEDDGPRVRTWSAKRNFSRHKVMVPTVARAGQVAVSGLSASVSLGGLFLVCAQALPRDTAVTVELAPPGAKSDPIRARGAVAYHRGQGMGIRFTGVSQGDYQRLQGLVRGFLRS